MTTDEITQKIPACDTTNPADLAAWFGNFGFADLWRKVVLANCKEIIRAENSATKISETRIDDLARVHDNYTDFLIDTLNGRRLYEKEVIAMRSAT